MPKTLYINTLMSMTYAHRFIVYINIVNYKSMHMLYNIVTDFEGVIHRFRVPLLVH